MMAIEPAAVEATSDSAHIGEWLILRMGMMAYSEAMSLQSALVSACRDGSIPASLIILEHSPVITLGKSSSPDEILASTSQLRQRHIDVMRSSRGGRVTYHGPGQIVAYPVLSIRSREIIPYVRSLEEVVIATLRHFKIAGARRSGYPGVWVGNKKIASVGVAVSRGVAHHGLALNVCPDMSAFDLIRPCGLTGEDMTSMADILGRRVDVSDVEDTFLGEFARTVPHC